MGKFHEREECIKLKHTTECYDLLMKQIYLRSNVKIQSIGAEFKKGKEVDVVNTHLKVEHSKFVMPYYNMYGYYQRKNRVEIGGKYLGDNQVFHSVFGGRSFKYDKWATQDFAILKFKPIQQMKVMGKPIYCEVKYTDQVKPLEGSVRANVNEASKKFNVTAKVNTSNNFYS